MPEIKLATWNVNGFRAVIKKGFFDWLAAEQPDIAALQETKANYEQVRDELHPANGYSSYWNEAQKPGYSGVACFVKTLPLAVGYGFGADSKDAEGRILALDYPEFTLLNIYFPNGKQSQERLDYKLAFYDATLDYCQILRSQGKKLVICGDYNTAHREIDLKNPKSNADQSGFLPVERAWIDKFIAHGYVDAFRLFHADEAEQYTWWAYWANARAKNVGWRIDYFFVSAELAPQVTDCTITPAVYGSDHCPVILKFKI